MELSKRRRRAKVFCDLLLANKKALITCSVILPILIWICDKSWSIEANMKGLGFTLADACFLLTYLPIPFEIVIVPLCVFLVLLLLKYDFNPSGIIRYQSRRELWLKQVGNTCVFSALAALYITVCSGVISLFTTKGVCNWNEKGSFFFATMLGKADKSGKFVPQTMTVPPDAVKILWMLFLFSFFSIATMSLIELLIQWLLGSYIIGFVVILAIALLDAADIPVFYTYSSILYDQWVKSVPVVCNMIFPAVWIAVLSAIGWLLAERKDFLSAQQK